MLAYSKIGRMIGFHCSRYVYVCLDRFLKYRKVLLLAKGFIVQPKASQFDLAKSILFHCLRFAEMRALLACLHGFSTSMVLYITIAVYRGLMHSLAKLFLVIMYETISR